MWEGWRECKGKEGGSTLHDHPYVYYFDEDDVIWHEWFWSIDERDETMGAKSEV